MSEIVSANNKMLQQQKEDKKAISEKQVANNEAINTVIANQQTLADDAQALTTKQAELKVAELNLAAEKATAENEKASLLEKKQQQRQKLKQQRRQKQHIKLNKQVNNNHLQLQPTQLLLHKYKQLQVLHHLHHQMMNQATHLQQLL